MYVVLFLVTTEELTTTEKESQSKILQKEVYHITAIIATTERTNGESNLKVFDIK